MTVTNRDFSGSDESYHPTRDTGEMIGTAQNMAMVQLRTAIRFNDQECFTVTSPCRLLQIGQSSYG